MPTSYQAAMDRLDALHLKTTPAAIAAARAKRQAAQAAAKS